jgi:membrane fusion protein (multidrug efflux system)
MTRSAAGRRLALAGLLVLGCTPLACQQAAAPAEEKTPPAPVKWEGVRQLSLEEWTELAGSTEPLPEHAARVTAPVEGLVLSVLKGAAGKPVVEGQPVKAGDVLVRLDDTVLRSQRDKAVSAKKVLLAEKETSQIAVKQAELEVRRLNELKRESQGGIQPLVSPIQLEQAALALDAAKARVRADDRKLEAADDEVAALDRQLKLYTLTAPRNGRLGRLQVVVGETLHVGAPVAEVVDIDDDIDVLCYVPAAEARRLQVGQPARVGGFDKDAAAEAGADPEGKVEYIADQAEPETGHFAVKVRFPNRDLKMRANAVIRVRVLTRPGKACWCVPEAALMEDQDPPGIVIVEDVHPQKNADGKEEQVATARRLKAVIGMRDRVLRQAEIVRLEDPEKKWHGDLESALIVVEKGAGVQTGDAVRLEEEEDDEAPPADKAGEKGP